MRFCKNIWEVDEHYLKYTFYDSVVEKSRAFFHSLFTRNIDYQMKIKIIKKIRKNPQIFIAEKGLKSIKKIAQAIIKAE